jgi:hypothetical protein
MRWHVLAKSSVPTLASASCSGFFQEGALGGLCRSASRAAEPAVTLGAAQFSAHVRLVLTVLALKPAEAFTRWYGISAPNRSQMRDYPETLGQVTGFIDDGCVPVLR